MKKFVMLLALVASVACSSASASANCDAGCNQTSSTGGYVNIPPQ